MGGKVLASSREGIRPFIPPADSKWLDSESRCRFDEEFSREIIDFGDKYYYRVLKSNPKMKKHFETYFWVFCNVYAEKYARCKEILKK